MLGILTAPFPCPQGRSLSPGVPSMDASPIPQCAHLCTMSCVHCTCVHACAMHAPSSAVTFSMGKGRGEGWGLFAFMSAMSNDEKWL